MLVTTEGYHLVEIPVYRYEVVIDVAGSLLNGKAYLTYLYEGEYIPLLNGTLEPDKGYVLAQKLEYPLYVLVQGSVNLSLVVSEKDYKKGYLSDIAMLPVQGYVEILPFTGTQVGQAIITGESVWVDNEGTPTYDLLPVDTVFDPAVYPQLALFYPTLTTPNIPQETGSPFPYKIVADYTGGS